MCSSTYRMTASFCFSFSPPFLASTNDDEELFDTKSVLIFMLIAPYAFNPVYIDNAHLSLNVEFKHVRFITVHLYCLYTGVKTLAF